MRSSPRAFVLSLLLGMLAAAALDPAQTRAATPAGSTTTSAAAVTPPPPRAVRVVRDIAVTTVGAPGVTVDVWRAGVGRVARRRPVALLVHGGGWHSGDKRQWEDNRWTRYLVDAGWVVVSANYRLSCGTARSAAEAAALRALGRSGRADARARDPRLCGYAMRTSISDVRATVRYVASSARRWGGDPARIVLFGASAGGQLAMLAASDPRRPAGIRAVVAISPPTDLRWIGARPGLPIHGSAAQSIGCSLAACGAAWRAASPLAQVDGRVTPPTWIFNAGGDPITPIAPIRAYAARLRAARVPVALVTTADRSDGCHGPDPCAGARLAGSRLGVFAASQAWLRPRI